MEVGGFIGAYRLEQPIGEGGMGAVWKARHPTLDRPVALKLIRSEVKASPQAREAFLREVRVLSRLHGPHILHVTDFGFTASGDPYMVTEFLEGEDLLARVRRKGPLAPAEAVDIGIEVLKALAEAHAVGLVHRDLKPGNVFLQKLAGGARTAVKVLDFGVAKLLEADDEDTLWPGARLKGSPRYMAPEQVQGESITPATDIYAFGAMMYRVLTGKPVFGGERGAVLRGHVSAPPPPMNSRAPGLAIPDELEDIVQGCLEKSPAERPGNAGALQARMERLARRLRDANEIDETRPSGLALDWSAGDLAAPPAGDESGSLGLGRAVGALDSGSGTLDPPAPIAPLSASEPGARGADLGDWFQTTGGHAVPPSDPPAPEPPAPEPPAPDPPSAAPGWGIGVSDGGASDGGGWGIDDPAADGGWGIAAKPPATAAEPAPALELDLDARRASGAADAPSMAGVQIADGGMELETADDDFGLELAFDPSSRGGRGGEATEISAPPPVAERRPLPPVAEARPAEEPSARERPAEHAPARPVAIDPGPAPEIEDRPDGYRPAPSVRIARVEVAPWHVEHRVPLIAGAAVLGLLLLVWIGRAALIGGMGVEPAEVAAEPVVDAAPRVFDLGVVPVPLDRGLAMLEVPSVARGPASHNGAPTSDQRPTVLVVPDPGPATIVRIADGEVICEDAASCRVPIDEDVRVLKKGFRPLRLRGDDLYDRRGASWRVILRR